MFEQIIENYYGNYFIDFIINDNFDTDISNT